jgi:hypothetical protein
MTLAAVIGFGLIIGSFLNVCIHRLPRGESVVWPASKCPRCTALLKPYDNIPVARLSDVERAMPIVRSADFHPLSDRRAAHDGRVRGRVPALSHAAGGPAGLYSAAR